MVDFRHDWSEGWIKEGHYLVFNQNNTRIFEYVWARDEAHYEYDWPETIASLSTSGPFVPPDLEITKGYDKATNTNQLWQLIFGIKGQVYIYVELPTDIHRHGIPKRPKPTSDLREVSHFEEWQSCFHEPTFITEHFMMRPDTPHIDFSAYNPNAIAMPDVRLNLFINKMINERIGTVGVENGQVVQNPSKTIYAELLDKLYRKLIPCRPITLLPVRAPAEAPAGE
jgi:hypothetical protein